MGKVSDSAQQMRTLIDNAVNTHEITIEEHEKIMMLASEDGIIDTQERALLSQLNDMISDKTIKFVVKK